MNEDDARARAYRPYMERAEQVAEKSRCNSIHRACILLTQGCPGEAPTIVTEGYNDTVNPTCLTGTCYKRKMGEGHGSAIFCHAMHAEQMAAGMAAALDRTAYYAVMNFHEMPCTNCLHNLKNVGVKVLVLLKPREFYCYNDQLMWDHEYKEEFEVIEYEQDETTSSNEEEEAKSEEGNNLPTHPP
jgi:deoxycytidylate deaminase